jgi:hypothetical protein
LRFTEGLLADAYDQVGRTAEARTFLKASRDDAITNGNPAGRITMSIRERWGRFLLNHGESAAAAAEYNAVLAAARDAASEPAAMAAAGLARIALAVGKLGDADRLSARAVSVLAATTMQYDVRFHVDVELVRAQVLAAEGRKAEARALAAQAVSASERTDAPESRRLAGARAVLANL